MGDDFLTVDERVALGREARRRVPRSSHAEFHRIPDAVDPVDLLERQAHERVADLVPIRYGRMLVSPFTFYRGAAMIMAADLARTPRSGLEVQCCGDAHLSNFGLYASPERRLVFDINDFDETARGPWEWDVKRLAVSMLIAASANGFPASAQDGSVLETVRAYRSRMAEFALMRNSDVWYTSFEIERLLPSLRSRVNRRMSRRLDRLIDKAQSRDSMQAHKKLARNVGGEHQIVSTPPLILRLHEFGSSGEHERTRSYLEGLLEEYSLTLPHDTRALLRQYRLVDLARKVVGVGSVGTAAWIALLSGRDGSDPLFLQIKEAQESVLEGFAAPSVYENAGERVVAGQRIMQASSDIFLGWLHVQRSVYGDVPRDYYVRQLRDWKGSVVIERMNPRALTVYGRLCADTLAHAHARSGDRIAIASYLGRSDTFDRAILAFACAYAEQNERDYEVLMDAARSGRIEARSGI